MNFNFNFNVWTGAVCASSHACTERPSICSGTSFDGGHGEARTQMLPQMPRERGMRTDRREHASDGVPAPCSQLRFVRSGHRQCTTRASCIGARHRPLELRCTYQSACCRDDRNDSAVLVPPPPCAIFSAGCTACVRQHVLADIVSTKRSINIVLFRADGVRATSRRHHFPQLHPLIPMWRAKLSSGSVGGHPPCSQRDRLCARVAGESFAARLPRCAVVLASSCAVHGKRHGWQDSLS